MKTHTDLSGLLAEIDALDLAPGSRAATDADGTLWGPTSRTSPGSACCTRS